ncbi:MAG: pantoate--beta-alanine ligase [Candidatus Omnitrophica bacterium]|nr:pantoate--beta-alanine ligase [Candidatus Omnitrophota bacterium]
MRIIRTIASMHVWSNRLRHSNRRIGFVPTMGYLHQGHLSLVKRSAEENDATVVSIFVNPLQFGPNEDFKKYPRTPKRDESMLREAGVDVCFYPSADRMYPAPYYTSVNVEYLTDTLCGRSRPGHFRGVATVVAKLFNIVKPHAAYFGQKDAQQAIVIKKMASDLNIDVDIKIMPIIRERDGLAMSSRNSYLNKYQREDAVILYKSLRMARRMINEGERSPGLIIGKIKGLITRRDSAKIDYCEIVDTKTLRPVAEIKGEVLIALAVYIGRTRLIDNFKMRVN